MPICKLLFYVSFPWMLEKTMHYFQTPRGGGAGGRVRRYNNSMVAKPRICSFHPVFRPQMHYGYQHERESREISADNTLLAERTFLAFCRVLCKPHCKAQKCFRQSRLPLNERSPASSTTMSVNYLPVLVTKVGLTNILMQTSRRVPLSSSPMHSGKKILLTFAAAIT